MIIKFLIKLFTIPRTAYLVRIEDTGMLVGAFYDKKQAYRYKRESSKNCWVQKITII